MEKAHSRIKWENYPSIATPLNETNLNKMDIALDEVDNRVLGLDTAKLDKAVANTMVKDIAFNEKTGIFTITLLDGTTKTIDTKLEKVATNFSYDYETQKLVLTLVDGTEQEIDMSTLISQYEFADTSTIGFTVGNEGKITAIVKDGSVTEDKLQPNFLADIKVEVAKGKSYSDSSYENATASKNAVNEAKQYRDEAKQFRDEAESFAPEGYDELKQQVNENTFKVDTIIEKADLGIKETASGEEIHLTDSAEGKAVEFALYGKATQDGEPTPQYPQPIEVSGASGSVAINSCGKNLIESVENLYWSTNANGGVTKDSESKKITITTTDTSEFSGCYHYMKDEFIGKKCTVSADITISSGSKIRFGFNGGKVINITANQKTRLHNTETITTKGIVVYTGELVAKTITVENLQIEYGDVATPFQEHKETLSTIPTPNGLAGIKVSSGENYTDKNGQKWICDEVVKYADGSGKHIQKIKKVVFDGVNLAFNTKSSSAKNNIFIADNKTRDLKKPPTNNDYANFFSSHFVIDTNDGSNGHGYGSSKPCMYGDYRYPNIYFGFGIDSEITSIDLANEWLKSNNVTVYYELETPIETPLTAEEIAEIEKLHTFYPITNISNDFDCGMSVKYNCDSKNYIDNKIALLTTAMINNI